MRLDIFEGNPERDIPTANYICAPACTGVEWVPFMHFAERCRDFCAFLLPCTWINSNDEFQRAWWWKKCIEKGAYRLSASNDYRCIDLVNSKSKGHKLFAKATLVEMAGSAKEVAVYAKWITQGTSNA
ncbi:hypothetical protein CYMTET_18724 [Cymbomonas tetramitiformis]|uniref:Uncharacterized protein n=1 Tax=Cymbomonas tetramitiformis TaxID=36881 RepID=A0AAE0G7H0_9CHLO|nr:hypothetical protein CYMTET_18724 [Cymbomonas tetramitiformis]